MAYFNKSSHRALEHEPCNKTKKMVVGNIHCDENISYPELKIFISLDSVSRNVKGLMWLLSVPFADLKKFCS